MPTTKPRKPRRRWRIVLAFLLILVVAVVLALRHYSRAEQLTALIVDQARGALGAELSVGGAAHYDFWPTLHLVLPAPSLKSPDEVAFVKADSLEVIVPWHILWADRYDIQRIDVIRPVLDLDALSAWLATRPASTTPLPDVRFSLHLVDGKATASGKVIAQGLNMDFVNSGDVAAWLARVLAQPDAGALVPPLNGSADAAILQIGTTRLEGVHLDVRDDATPPAKRE
jgi:hypothetical protein